MSDTLPNIEKLHTGALLASSYPLSTVTLPRVTGSSLSGMRIFEIARDAGILMTDEVIKVSGGTPRFIYATKTEPAIVEKPEVMVTSSS